MGNQAASTLWKSSRGLTRSDSATSLGSWRAAPFYMRLIGRKSGYLTGAEPVIGY